MLRYQRRYADSVLIGLMLAVCLLVPPPAQAASSLSWSSPSTIDPGHSLVALSCEPGISVFCAAVDNAGKVLTSSNPSGGASAWQTADIDGSTPLTSVSCGRGCIAVDGLGSAFVSSEPSGGASTWTKTTIDPGQVLTGVSCPLRDGTAIDFCLAIDRAGNSVMYTGSWHVEPLDTSGGHLLGVTCPEFSEWCLAFDDLGNVLTANDPTNNPWTLTAIDAGHQLSAASCPYVEGTSPSEYCVVGDTAGRLLTSTTPAAGANAWSVSQLDTHGLSGVSCPVVLEGQFCAAVDTAGDVLTSADPLGGASAWQTTPLEPGTPLTAIVCPFSEQPFCVVTTANGDVLVGTTDGEPPPSSGESPPEARGAVQTSAVNTGGSSNSPSSLGSRPTPPAAISSAQLAVLLKQQLVPHGKRATIGNLLRHGGLVMPFTAPEAGTLSVSWFLAPGETAAHPTAAKPVLIATGRLTLAAAGTGQLKLKLTVSGSRRLRHMKRVPVVAKVGFTPLNGTVVDATTHLIV